MDTGQTPRVYVQRPQRRRRPWGQGLEGVCCLELEGTAEASMEVADGGSGCGGWGWGRDRHWPWDTPLPTKAPLEAV